MYDEKGQKMTQGKRYYYDDALKAAYMCKYHKIEFVLMENLAHRADYIQLLHFALGNIAAGLKFSTSNMKYYIHPDSYKMLEPQDGDKDEDGYQFCLRTQGWYKLWGDNEFKVALPEERTTAFRNGKTFFTPILEE